jgi:hypothetical protein
MGPLNERRNEVAGPRGRDDFDVSDELLPAFVDNADPDAISLSSLRYSGDLYNSAH